MADVARIPGVFEQIRIVAALRWRILRNSMQRKDRWWDMVGLIFSSIMGAVFVFGIALLFFFIGLSLIEENKPGWFAATFWGISAWWQIIPIFVAGFSPSFQFRTLLRFPMTMPAFYLIGIAYGLADSAALASMCWLTALTAGVTAAKPSLFPVFFLISVIFVFMNVSLERLLGSWLEKILSKRRAREVFLAIFILLCVSLQFIGTLAKKFEHAAKPDFNHVLPYISALPPSLAGEAVRGAAAGEWSAAATGIAGLALYTFLFGVLLWRRYAVQYRGEELSETAAPERAEKRAEISAATDSGWSILPPQVSAVFQKEWRYLTRNSFSFISLIVPPVVVLLFATQFAGPNPTVTKHGVPPDLFFPGVMAYLVLILMAPAYNAFAYEGRGIQTYYMMPMRFREVFLGKNLFLVSLMGLELVLCVGVLGWRIGLPALPVLASTLLAIAFAVAGQLSIANWSSLMFPRKMTIGQMRGQRNSGMAVLIAFGAQFVLGPLCALIFFAGRWTGNPWLPATVFALLAAAAIAGYFSALQALSGFAEKKKEVLIEALCR